MIKLVPFLSRDNATLSGETPHIDLESESAISRMIESFESLQLMSTDDFFSWVETGGNAKELSACIGAFFQLRQRPDTDNPVSPSPDAKSISKLMLMILTRLVLSDRVQSTAAASHGFIALPLLMDCAALYYNSNPRIVKRIVQQAFDIPGLNLVSRIPALSQQIATQLSLIAEECCSSSSKVVVKIGGGGDELAQKSISLINDSLIFLHDMCYSLRAFISSHPSIAPAFMQGSGPGLMSALADIHDRAMPKVAKALSSLPHSKPASSIQSHLRLLAFQLLRDSFLFDASGDAEKKGEAMMMSVMAAVHSNTDSSKGGSRSLLNDLNRTHELDVGILMAMEKKHLTLDDAQLDYLLAVLGSDRVQVEAKAKLLFPLVPETKASTSSASSSSNPYNDLSPLISQVKDILPDLGDGFIIACLIHFDRKADLVVNSLLEGTLHPSLASLDISLASWNPPLALSVAPPSAWANAASDRSQWESDEARRLIESRSIARLPEPRQAPQSHRKVHRGVSRVLGSVDKATRAMTRQLAHRIEEDELERGVEEGEYDDEYDDSFDGLATAGMDGLADIEGDDSSAAPRPRESSSLQVSSARGMQPARAPIMPSATAGPSHMRPRAPINTALPSSSLPFYQPQERAMLNTGASSSSAQGGGGGRGKGSGKDKMWIFEGRIYHYPKPGAREVSGVQEANEALQAAEDSKLQIHGLGPGGNKGILPVAPPASDPEPKGQQQDEGLQYPDRDGGGRGGQGGRGGRGGRGPPNYARKEQNKAAVGNHHRKDKAMRKMGL